MHHARFDAIAEVVDGPVSGVLFDLGVSSPQLDRGERGFAFRNDGPLDMRMDPTTGRSAADIVNESSLDELAQILRDGGENAVGVSHRARHRRTRRPIETTGELAEIVRSAIPAAARRKGGHPATRTFQALRIAVNDELAILPGAIDDAIAALAPRGRCVVLAYHSGEDRIVKERFNEAVTGGCIVPADSAVRVRRRAEGEARVPRLAQAVRRRTGAQPSRRKRAPAGVRGGGVMAVRARPARRSTVSGVLPHARTHAGERAARSAAFPPSIAANERRGAASRPDSGAACS